MTKSHNEAGFTLIELIAVIIILGIIALIAVPVIGNIVEDSKKDTYLASMRELIKAGDMYYADNGYTNKACISVNDENLDYKNKGEKMSGQICYEDGQAYLKDVVYNNYVFNGNTSNLTISEIGEGITPVYTLSEQYFDGVDDYIDTGYALFDEDKDFTIVVSVTSNSVTNSSLSPTVFHCMEESNTYPGLVLDQMNASGRLAGAMAVNNIFSQAMQNNKNILVVKRDTTAKSFSYYIFDSSGEIYTKTSTVNSVVAFNKHLLLGAYQNAGGTKGRYFKGTIHHFDLYMEALDDVTISNIMNEYK